MSSKETIQEDLYEFPYHHIPAWGDGAFRHYRVLPPAYEYVSYCKYVAARLEQLEVQSILDVGCGDGRLCAELRRLLPHTDITGIDISERAIGFARLLVPGCQFVVGSVEQSKLAGEPFEAATLIEVLEHIDPVAVPSFLEGIRARLRDRGVLLVTVPSSNVQVSPKHYRHFDEASLREVLSPPFRVDEMVFLNRIASWHALLYRLMSNQLFILANPRLLAWLLRLYERSSLRAGCRDCSRLLAVCRIE